MYLIRGLKVVIICSLVATFSTPIFQKYAEKTDGMDYTQFSTTDTISLVDSGTPYGPQLYIGLALSISSSIFIGSSFIIKKKSLLALGKSGGTRAGAGGYGYLRHWLWWAGLLSMGLGEALNFVAYVFAPATLVTPLGALSVLVTSILSAYFLGEALNLLGKVGCALCLLGSSMVVLHAPKETEVTSMEDLASKLIDPSFIVYVVIVLCVSMVLIIFYAPRYGSRNVIVYISICSLIGGFSVLGCKTLGLAVKDTIEGNSQISNGYTWFAAISLFVCVGTQMNYLNKALDIFNTSLVTPIYYVFFTTCVIIASAMLFKEWKGLAAEDVIGVLVGFGTVVIGIVLLHAFKDMDVSCIGMSAIMTSQVLMESRRTSMQELTVESLNNDHQSEEEELIVSDPQFYGSSSKRGY